MTDTTPAPTGKKKSAARFVTPVLVVVAALGIGVVGGVLIGQNTASSPQAVGMGVRPDGATGDAPAGGLPGGGAGGFTSGTVTAVDGSTVTLELDDGSTVTVTTTDDTAVTTTDEASVSDLAEGDSLTVVGETDDDGNVAATSINEGAAGFGGMGAGNRPTDDSAN